MTSRARLLLATAVLAALSLTACGSDEQATDPGDGAATASDTAAAAPTDSPTTDPSTAPPSSSGADDTVAVPLYFVGDTPQGPRLFREFQQVSSAKPADEALAKIAAGEADDPDYTTLLPSGGYAHLLSYDENALITVDSSWAERPAGMTRSEARLAVQQIVRTVQGVLQKQIPVAFYVGDTPSPILGLDQPSFAAAGDLKVLGLVNITTPEQGATVSGTFTATGLSSSFEATTPWELRAADGTVVKSGFATAEGWMDKLYPWTTEVDLAGVAPGDYTFAAMTDDPSGGEGGGPTEDTKAITVQ